ncbi:ketoacyl-synt-domain-containing protein [Canariomyces notabilis]|uniref:Ketoacyl-synt-domain-containing protein n=1 Tax=Canariomyces notabilis TaxID=2074819 RepID=A0AAN6TDV1_9PEZI|nr:ketoacyl-synt-domain-containing protein [Canariomyces arenarius]
MSPAKPVSKPIGIVGASCRFAGGVTNPSKLWQLLANPTDLSQKIPANRFNIEAFFHPDGEYHGTTNSPKAYFLDQDHRVFDCSFFNIAPKEAEAMDPQQRMLLEVVYEALESAGYTLRQYSGKKVGVFAGLMTADYDTLLQRDELDSSQYYATGNARSILSNRISYFFNFTGPSMTLDTACSSSLVALHQAVLSLRSGECEMACVAGSNLILTPEQFIAESNLHMLSPSGHCRMWDAGVDGYARGEGVAAVLVKPLSSALRDGDRIEAIIRETGVNSDGRTLGITMPNWQAQSQLIRDTYNRAGLDPKNPEDRCQYFEAHGTGTSAGDPTEAHAIEDAFFGPINHLSPKKAAETKILVGSIKTVIGHTEGAAGLAGLLKVVESMRNGSVPPNLHLDKLSPAVEKFYTNLLVPTDPIAWPEPPTGRPKRGSVNSFGFGGTNAHAIVEQYIPYIHNPIARLFRPGLKVRELACNQVDRPKQDQVWLPLLLSATSQTSLGALARTYRAYIHSSSPNLGELAWHSFARRTAFPFRLSLAAGSVSGLVDQLDSIISKAQNQSADTIGTRVRQVDESPKILGIFTGQGAQWATMCRRLLQTSKVYARTIRALDDILRSCRDPPWWTLEEQIMAEDSMSMVHKASVSQPLCTAIQLAFVDLLRDLGITFRAVVGHSSGEIAAAYAAGRVSLREAILISHYRGLSVHMAGGANGAKGGMLAAGLSKAEAAELCAMEEYCRGLFLAASNAPSSVTLSGDLDLVRHAHDYLTKQQKFCRLLFVDAAYHSPHMERPAVKYLKDLKACNILPSMEGNGTVWVSSVSGENKPSAEALSASYWRDNMVNPVLFYEAISTTLDNFGPFDCAIEVGPHPALKGPVVQIMKEKNGTEIPYLSVLNRTMDDRQSFAEFLGQMWTHFDSSHSQIRQFVLGSVQPELVDSRLDNAPFYPWDHSLVHYRESRISRQYHFKTGKPHELLGVRTRDDNKHQLRWRNILKLEKLEWVKHHSFQGQALLPASAYLVMALDAARVALSSRSATLVELQDLQFPRGIVLEPDTNGVEVLFSLTIENETEESIEASISLTSTVANDRTDMKKNFSGRLMITIGSPSTAALPSRATVRAETLPASPEAFYAMIAGTGLEYTGPFKGLQTLERRYNFSSGTLRKLHLQDSTNLPISPATLDSCLQTAFVTISSPGDGTIWTSFLPLHIDCVRFNTAICDIETPEDSLAVDAYLTKAAPFTPKTPASFTADIEIFNPQGDMEIQIQGLTVGSISSTKPEADYGLYLTTKFDIDPDHEIVAGDVNKMCGPSMLGESCERVASFYVHRPVSGQGSGKLNHWSGETDQTLDRFIRASPYFRTLSIIRWLGHNKPDVVEGMLPSIIREAHHLAEFQKHVSRVVQQITHKYPRINVLGLTDRELGLSEHVLEGLADSFLSYRIGAKPEDNLGDRIPLSDTLRKKIAVDEFDLNTEEPATGVAYDLVILTTSLIQSGKTATAFKKIRNTMRPGGFLILVDVSKNPLEDHIQELVTGRGPSKKATAMSPPYWPDLLDRCGFEGTMRRSNQYYPPGFSLIVRQAGSHEKSLLLHPLADLSDSRLTDTLLVIGGKQDTASRISSLVCSALRDRCGAVKAIDMLDNLHALSAASSSAVIILGDLDEPILATMTEKRMDSLRALFRPEMIILWVTHNARFHNPDHAASFGFTRTLAAETPGLVLQVLDLDDLNFDLASKTIVETFARLTRHNLINGESNNTIPTPLWTNEREVHVEQGRRFVPRVVPWKEGNDRVNAPRRVVSNNVNTLDHVVQIVKAHSEVDSNHYEITVGGALIWNMLPSSSRVSQTLAQCLPANCQYNPRLPLVDSDHPFPPDAVKILAALWNEAVSFSCSKAVPELTQVDQPMVSVADLLQSTDPTQPPFQIIDWKAERNVSQIVKPLAGTKLLSPNKTRNPPKTAPKWQTELCARGMVIRFEALDVTDLDQVTAFKTRLAATLPPVGGVVNGAMVLEDGVFSQMTLASLQRVMRPKTVGSSNLDQVFNSPDMEFFIMTSSFAAIGGHAGQSNYAAANMYMNGLAASRRRRGLPGSVLNIGVIYGLGFLHRERDVLYEGLEREGYPPISERDIHHMFVEAIVAGRPEPGQVYDITTGLRRFDAGNPTLHWHFDPRFSHFSRLEDDAGNQAMAGAQGASQQRGLKELVDAAASREEIVEVLVKGFIEWLQSKLQLAEGSVTGDHSPVEVGVDSLAAVEIRSWIWKSLALDVAVMKILSGASIMKLCRDMADTVLRGRKQ